MKYLHHSITVILFIISISGILLKDTIFAGCSKRFRCKASQEPDREAY